MNGIVDEVGRAILGISILADTHPQVIPVDVWIDTGFTGEIVFPNELIKLLGLKQSGTVGAVLADGSQVQLNTYSAV